MIKKKVAPVPLNARESALEKKDQPRSPVTAKKDIVWYIKNICNGCESFSFATQEEADTFGNKMRKDLNNSSVKVDITYLTVRVTIPAQE